LTNIIGEYNIDSMLEETVLEDDINWGEMRDVEQLLKAYFRDFPNNTFKLQNLRKSWVLKKLSESAPAPFLSLPNLEKYHSFCLYSYKMNECGQGVYLIGKTPPKNVLPFPDATINRGANNYFGVNIIDDSVRCECKELKEDISVVAMTEAELSFLKAFMTLAIEADSLEQTEGVQVGELE